MDIRWNWLHPLITVPYVPAHVLASDIIQISGLALIPSSIARRQCVRVLVYSQNPHSVADSAGQLSSGARWMVVFLQRPGGL